MIYIYVLRSSIDRQLHTSCPHDLRNRVSLH